MQLSLKRGFDRLFLVLTGIWVFYWVFVFPFEKASEVNTQYHRELASCQEEGQQRQAIQFIIDCTATAGKTWEAGLKQWSDRQYLHDWWKPLLLLTIIPPIVGYILLLGIAATIRWVWGGFQPKVPTLENPHGRKYKRLYHN